MKGLIKGINNQDIRIFYLFNNSFRCKTLDRIMPYMTRLGGAFFTVTFSLILLIYSNIYKQNIGYKCAISLASSHLLVQILKRTFTRPRPFDALINVNAHINDLKDYSFPSGHTTAAFSLTVPIAAMMPQFAPVLLFIALSVGISRVYLGVHYPTDIFVGAFIGTTAAMLSGMILSDAILHFAFI